MLISKKLPLHCREQLLPTWWHSKIWHIFLVLFLDYTEDGVR